MSEKTNISINSTMCYVLAFMCTTMFHELAHALAGAFSNSEPVLYHNYVQHLSTDHLSVAEKTRITLAGPIVSLIQGFLAGAYFLFRKKRGLLDLFILWLSILGFNNFLGYVMTGPLFKAGDIGKTYILLEISMTAQILAAVFAALFLLLIANKMSRPFLEFSSKDSLIKPEKKARNFSFSIIMVPWIIGSVMITFLYLPIINIVSIIYPIMSGMIFIYPWQNAVRIKNVSLSSARSTGSFSWKLLSLLLCLIIIFRWVLPSGIYF